MLIHTWRFAAVSLVALLLAACSITVVPWVPPASTADLTAEVYDPLGNDAPTTQYSGQVGANQTLYFDLSVPTARDLLYAEVIGTDVRVSLQTTAGSILSVSSSPRYFASSIAALAAPAELAPANISTSFFCDGPCAAIRPQGTSYLIAVRNLGAVPRPFQLAAYTMDATDLNEPNGSLAAAAAVGANAVDFGAIEWLGDDDWFTYTGVGSGTLELKVYDLDLGIAMQVFPSSPDEPSFVVQGSIAGASVGLLPGDVLRVYSANGRAGPSVSSRYRITTTVP